MILRNSIIALFLTIFLCSCSSTKPLVWKDRDVSFAKFNGFQILPVYNATGNPVDHDLLSFLSAEIRAQFQKENLQLIDAPQTGIGILTVKNEILIYENNRILRNSIVGAKRRAKCTLRTRLVDKSTDQVVGEISVTTLAGTGVFPESNANVWVLKESAILVAREVAKMM